LKWNAVAPRKWELFTPQPFDCQARSDEFLCNAKENAREAVFCGKRLFWGWLNGSYVKKIGTLAPWV